MSKRRVAAVKLFDNRNPAIHSRCGRQERWCSCFLELTNQTSKLNISAYKICEDNQKDSYNKNVIVNKQDTIQTVADNESNSSKENDIFTINDEIFTDDFPFVEDSKNEIENISNNKKEDIDELSMTDLLDETSNSITNNCIMDFEISSVDETSNSSWNNTSPELLASTGTSQITNSNRKTVATKTTRNTFPTVFNKTELPFHMNMSSDKDDIIIPIKYRKRSIVTRHPDEKCTTVAVNETSADYDLDSDRLNTSLFEFPVKSSNSNNSGDSMYKNVLSEKGKNSYRSEPSKNKVTKSNRVLLYAYISDIKGIEDSLILNKDRRFTRILERYNCKASIVQLKNLTRGFPHTLLKIESPSKLNLTLMARDTDRIHLSWNLRSQLRSVHVH